MSKTVHDLIQDLQGLPQDAIVVLARDEEWNGFNKYYQADLAPYDPDQDEAYHPDDIAEWEDEEGIVEAVILWG